MAYDLSLNRLDHDMQFSKVVLPDKTVKWELFAIEGADRVAQQIKINLMAFLGEWFLDITFGVPYLEQILIKNPRMPVVETILRQHINSVPDVIRIDSLSIDWDRRDRTLQVDFQCETTLGPIKDSYRLEITRAPGVNPV